MASLILQKKIWLGIFLTVIGFIIAFNAFYNLHAGMLKDWDEARHGVSAIEMLESGSYLVNTWGGKTDYWNSKPPLSFWAIVLGYKIFDISPFGLRFFSAAAGCLLLYLTIFFCLKNTTIFSAVCTGLILMSMQRFFLRHGIRSGDPDAIFLLFNTISLLLVLSWPKRYISFYIASFFAALAFLTKGFHAAPLVFLLILFYFIDFPCSIPAFCRGLICLLIALLPVGGWAVCRYRYDGYEFFSHLFLYDVVHRASETIDGHSGNIFYYISLLLSARNFLLWFVLVICIWGVSLVSKKLNGPALAVDSPLLSRLLWYKLLVTAFLPVGMFSLCASKLSWYVYPSFPFLALLMGVFLGGKITLFYESRHARWLAGLFFCAAVVISSVSEVSLVKKIIRDSYPNPVHLAMRNLGQSPDVAGARLFRSAGQWTQSDVLAARFYGPFHLDPGGMDVWKRIKGKKGCFLILAEPNQ